MFDISLAEKRIKIRFDVGWDHGGRALTVPPAETWAARSISIAFPLQRSDVWGKRPRRIV